MLYFSELKGNAIVSRSTYIGALEDLIFKGAATASVTKLVVKTSGGDTFFIPISQVMKLGRTIFIKEDYARVHLEEGELFVGKNVVDQQIIDITGSKMVRVNDVVLIQQPQLHISGVDVGILGILRWLGLEDFFQSLARIFHRTISPHFLSWGDVAPLELARGKVVMKRQDINLKRLKPEDLAVHLDRMNIRNVRRIINLLDDSYAADVINNLNVSFQTALFKSFTHERAAKVVSLLDQHEAVDILLTLDRSQRSKIIELLDKQKQDEIRRLMLLSKTPIGDLISLEYCSVGPNATAREVKTQIQRNPQIGIHGGFVYVVNEHGQLVGVFNLLELISQRDETPVYEFMSPNIAVVHISTPKEIAVKKMLKYEISALPVIDNARKLVGVIRWYDAVKEN